MKNGQLEPKDSSYEEMFDNNKIEKIQNNSVEGQGVEPQRNGGEIDGERYDLPKVSYIMPPFDQKSSVITQPFPA